MSPKKIAGVKGKRRGDGTERNESVSDIWLDVGQGMYDSAGLWRGEDDLRYWILDVSHSELAQ